VKILKNKNQIAKNIFKGLLLAGSIAVAATSPYFISKVLPKIIRYAGYKVKNVKYKKSFYNTFYRLKKEDLIQFENKNGQIYISLTKEGKAKAGKYQIDDLAIEKPKKWDGKWRMLIFDIKDKQKLKREALRGKIKQLGLFQLQKSVWVYPYDFEEEMKLLRSFFNLTQREMQFIVADEIESGGDLKNYFKMG
jgi:DNA-binding transcriptional regulator PaaX